MEPHIYLAIKKVNEDAANNKITTDDSMFAFIGAGVFFGIVLLIGFIHAILSK